MMICWSRWVERGHQQRLPLGSWFTVVIMRQAIMKIFNLANIWECGAGIEDIYENENFVHSWSLELKRHALFSVMVALLFGQYHLILPHFLPADSKGRLCP
jgi:hypothetical protein